MNLEEINDTLYCRFEGNINATACADIGRTLTDYIDAALIRIPEINVVFDLKETRFIASSFLRLCVLCSKKVGKEHFRVENASEEIRNVFNIVGLADYPVQS
jgi:anti-anti-sigma factor